MYDYFTVLRAYHFLALRDFGIPPQRQDQAGIFSGFFLATAKVTSITAMIFFHVIGLSLLKSGGCLYSRHISLAGQTYACFVFRDVLHG